MEEFVLRFLIGGAVISVFALLGDVLRPKSFAGLFGAAPSIALATVGMTIARHGKEYAATEARSMVLGAIAFCVYEYVMSQALVAIHDGDDACLDAGVTGSFAGPVLGAAAAVSA
jgi:hypothetical protein